MMVNIRILQNFIKLAIEFSIELTSENLHKFKKLCCDTDFKI